MCDFRSMTAIAAVIWFLRYMNSQPYGQFVIIFGCSLLCWYLMHRDFAEQQREYQTPIKTSLKSS